MSKPNESLGYLVGSLSYSINRSFTALLNSHNVDLTKEQWVILKIIVNNGSMTQTEITNFLKKDKTTITRSIDSLAKNEYVVRVNNPDDKRVHIIELTEKAWDTMAYLEPFVKERMNSAIAFMTEKEQETFKKNLIRIKENLTELI
jgi:DNA-binding MarR family transcriptional regulator